MNGIQFSSVTQLCPTLCDPMNHSTPGLPVHHQLQEFTQTHIHRVGDAIQPSHPCHPLLLPPIPPSIRVFSNEPTLRMRWPKYWSFSFSIIPSKEHPGLISFRMDWLDLLAVQGTLRSLLQHHSSKASILRHSAFFTIQLSHPYTIREMKIKSQWDVPLHALGLLFSKTTTENNKCCQGHGEIGICVYCWWNCNNMVQLPRKIVRGSSKNIKHDPAIPLLGIHRKQLKAGTQTDICTPILIAALFTIAKK